MVLRCYPRIFDFFYEISGQAIDLRAIPIFSYGFFVAMGFLVAAYIAVYLLKQREKEGYLNYELKTIEEGGLPSIADFLINFVIIAFVAMKLLGYNEFKTMLESDPQMYLLSLKGNWIGGLIVGLLGAIGLFYYKYKNSDKEVKTVQVKVFPHQRIGDLLVIAAILGVLGANLFNLLENPEDYATFWQDPIGSLFSGLSVFGGLICAAAGFWIYARIKNIPVLHLFDSVAPGFIMANGIGRLGCHVSGDGDWGIENLNAKPDWIPQFLWTDHYEHNIINAGVPIPGCTGDHCNMLPVGVYPTPIYEFVMLGIACLILVWISKNFKQIQGFTFSVFLIFAGLERLLIEQIRDLSDRKYVAFLGYEFPYFGRGMKQAEFISVMMLILGIVFTIYLSRKLIKKEVDK